VVETKLNSLDSSVSSELDAGRSEVQVLCERTTVLYVQDTGSRSAIPEKLG